MYERIFCDPSLSEHDHTDKSICYSSLGSDMIEIDVRQKGQKGYVLEEIPVCRTSFDTRA